MMLVVLGNMHGHKVDMYQNHEKFNGTLGILNTVLVRVTEGPTH
jgi:hypothetical protein